MKDKSVVTIKPLAYYKMLLHVLRFGSKVMNKNKFNEVMGVLIGRLEGEGEIKNVIVEDAIPVSHGGSIEVEFSSEQLGAFGQLDNEIWENYGDLGWFSVGWYHSHPGLTIFFSGTDIKNQMFWQGRNPSGIGIVFDHNYLETDNEYRKAHNIKKVLSPGEIDYGFRTFRLIDPSSITSKWYEVETVIELPDSLEYYLKLGEIIDKVHTQDSFILELNETPDIFSNVVIPYPDQLMVDRYEINVDALLVTFKESVSKFIDSAFNPLLTFLNTWSQEIVSKILTNNTQIRESLVTLKETLSTKISKIQRDFKSSLSFKLDETNGYISDRIERFDKEFESIENNISNLKQDFENQINQVFNQEIKPSVESLENMIKENTASLIDINDKQNKTKESIDQEQDEAIEVSQKITAEKELIANNINESKEKINKLINENVNSFSGEIDLINNQIKELSSTIENVILAIEMSTQSISTIKEQMNKLKSKNESLENKIKALESDNPELLEKIDNLTSLESEKIELDKKINEITAQNTKLEQEVKNFETEKHTLQKDLDTIKTEKTVLENKLKEMEGKNSEIQEKYTNLESERVELQKKVNLLEEESEKGKKKKKEKKKK
ncbi:MAG: hypothetical protein ACFFBP_04625 [Promethearchaeota archaeon]